MSIYEYDNPDDAYAEALRRIKKAGKAATELDLRVLGLTAVPPEIAQLTNLTVLNLDWNQLTAVPPEIAQLANLTELNLGDNQLTAVPPEIAQLANLTTLYLGNNQLTAVPPKIAQLANLTMLDLGDNQLTAVPPEIAQLANLTELYLYSNQLTAVPPEIAQLANLTKLSLGNNQLTAVPPEITQLTNLTTLDLGGNQLTAVPPEIAQLTNLTALWLYNNKIEELPNWLVQLPRLKKLLITGNPINTPPPELLGKALTADWYKDEAEVDLESVRRYYAELARAGEAYFYEAKLLLIGEGGAGKTSLARKLLNPANPLPAKENSTEGIDILKYEFPIPPDLTGLEEHYTANIWDFGGQSIYHATHQFFLSKRSVYILLADTRRQHTDFYDWLQMQEAFGRNSPVLLLKNKNREHNNQYPIENLPYLHERFPNLKEIFELDLKSVPHEKNWEGFLSRLQDHLLTLDHIGVSRPRSWINIRQILKSDTRDNISRRAFLSLCAQHDLANEADALQLSDYLHHVGDILHFEKDPVLRDLVILNPTWALDAVYRVLDNKAIIANKGQFNLNQLRDLWYEEKYDTHRTQLLRLMQKFKLCYPLGDDAFIAPQLLPSENPAYDWDKADNLQLRYRYPVFMPRGILGRAIATLHKRIESQALVWRTGVILRDKFARAELLELRGEKEIRIRVTGGNKRDLLMEIIRALDDLHSGFSNKLQYDKLVPCICDTCAPSATPHFFRLGKLLERLSHRKETIECNNPPYADVQIRTMIDDAVIRTSGTNIYNIAGDYIGADKIHGNKHDGDNITVDNISHSTVGIGRSASASAS